MTLWSLVCTSAKLLQSSLTLQSSPEVWDCAYQHDEPAKSPSRKLTSSLSCVKAAPAARRNSRYLSRWLSLFWLLRHQPGRRNHTSGPGSSWGKVGTVMAATAENNKTMSGFYSGCNLRGLPDSYSLPSIWEISITIITMSHSQI